MEQPVIETQRLLLNFFKDEDLQDIFNYCSDEETARYVLWHSHKSLEDAKSFLTWARETKCTEPGKVFFVWAVRDKNTKQVIGSFDFKQPQPFIGQFDYTLSRQHWGKGFITEAGQAIFKWAKDSFPEVVRFQAYCVPENTGSRRVMEKMGLEYEGTRRKSMLVKGRPVDLAHYAYIR